MMGDTCVWAISNVSGCPVGAIPPVGVVGWFMWDDHVGHIILLV